MTAALSTASDYNTNNNTHLIQQQEQEGELHNSISNSREQDSFRMLVFHLSERITEITDILRRLNVLLRICESRLLFWIIKLRN